MKIDKDMLNEEQLVIVEDFIPKVSNLIYNDKYKEVSLEERMFSLEGAAGTGKSVTTSVIIKEVDNLGFSIRACTPTHKSLNILAEMIENTEVVVPQSTIHSYLGLKVKECHETGRYKLEQEYGSNPPEPVDLLLVDESSMVSPELYEYIKAEMEMNVIKVVLFISDKYQLPPVDSGENPIYENDKITKYLLLNVVRQAQDSNILKFATAIRDSIKSGKYLSNLEIKELAQEFVGDDLEIIKSDKEFLQKYFDTPYSSQENLVVAYKNATVSKYNKKIRNTLIEEDECFSEGELLVFNEAHFDSADNCVHRNNETVEIQSIKKLEDSSLGINYWKIIDTEDRVFRAVDFNDLMDYDFELNDLAKQAKKAKGLERSALWARFFELKKSFQNVSYTYAYTSHKTQGSTCCESYVVLDELLGMRSVIDAETMLRSIYVAVTRPKHKLLLLMK